MAIERCISNFIRKKHGRQPNIRDIAMAGCFGLVFSAGHKFSGVCCVPFAASQAANLSVSYVEPDAQN